MSIESGCINKCKQLGFNRINTKALISKRKWLAVPSNVQNKTSITAKLTTRGPQSLNECFTMLLAAFDQETENDEMGENKKNIFLHRLRSIDGRH